MVTLGKDPTGVYQKMINQNIITPVIESKSQKTPLTWLQQSQVIVTGIMIVKL